MVMTDSPVQAGNGRPLWLDLASVIAGEKLERRAAFVLGFVLLAIVVVAAVVVAVGWDHPTQHSGPALSRVPQRLPARSASPRAAA